MKKLIAWLLSCALILTGFVQVTGTEVLAAEETQEEETTQFDSLDDPDLLNYLEDAVYTGLSDEFQSEDYIIEDIQAVYVSKEYLEEIAYNSQANIWFGYTLEELKEQFTDMPYVFALADDGQTEAVPFEDYDGVFEKVIRNVTIGTGVILICATVSVVTGAMGIVPVSVVFAASAKTAASVAVSTGVLSGAMAGALTAVATKDPDKALKVTALEGSDAFKWGAIAGALSGGINAAWTLRSSAEISDIAENATKGASSSELLEKAREAELRALETYGGSEQVTYLGGQEVAFGTPGATRPDIVRVVGDHIEAIEVKYYNLESSNSVRNLCRELKRQVSDRITNLPEGSTQRIVLDVTDRGFSESTVQKAVDMVRDALKDIYPDIPIDIVGV